MLSASNGPRDVTDQSHESSKMLHAVVENMTEGVVISTLDGHIVHWNHAALRLHGFADFGAWSRRLDEFVSIFELSTLAGQIVPFEEWPMSRLIRGQELEKVELRIRRLDTDWNRVMSYGGSMIRDATGNKLAFLTISDVTEAKRNELALAQFNERLRILRQIDLAMLAGDAPETIAAATLPLVRDLLGVRRAVVNLFNLATSEVEWLAAVGRRRVHVGPGVRYSIQFMGDIDGLRRGEPQRVDVDALPRGKEVDALLTSGVHDYTVVPMFAKGELIGALSFGGASAPFSKEQLAIAQEVANQFAIALTQARLYENVQRQAEELKSAFEDTDVAMVLTDIDHRFLRVNAAFARMFGYTREEILGKTMPDITHPDDIAESMAKREVLNSGKISHFQVEKRYVHKNGHIIWGLANVSLIRTAQGQPFQYFGQVQDITERKLLEDQFRQAQKMEAVGRLAGGVAHDFNNLLTVIIGYSEISINQLGDSATRPLIEQIKRAGERASLLTRQLLAFSRKQILAPAVLDLNAQLADMEKMLFRLIGEDIEFHFHRAANIWSVLTDAGQLEQVVMNLAINARDAMPTGGKLTIETANVVLDNPYVSVHTQARPGEHVLLAISDTGCGMDAATKAKIFEPFFTTKHPDKGTGLGLATVFGIVKQSGGHVEVYSEVGVGTTFKVYLPRHRGPKQAPITMHGEIRAQGIETILLAEDEESVRTLARMVLESQGYKVIQAGSGLEAVQICEEHPETIQLLITDVVMPNMNGRQTAERITARRPGMKVLFLSGYTDDAIVRHGVLQDNVPFLQKPFTAHSLAQKVREILDRDRAVMVS